MRIDLIVPYDQKDIAKRRGAKWDVANKKWYIENVTELDIFRDWIPSHLMRPTQSKPLKHPIFKVTQPRTPRKKNNKRR